MKKKIAMITGITGQDGGYLAKMLLEKGYSVVGLRRRSSSDTLSNLADHGILDKIELENFELLEMTNICRLIEKYKPDEFYNLAAQSYVKASWDEPVFTVQADGVGVLYILEAIREFSPKTKFYQASTSEMFGKVQTVPQNEMTPFYPRSPYGCAKLFAHWATVNYRESFDIFACSGILFNHESPMRGKEFVTRKITTQLAKLSLGLTSEPLELGNIDAKRDWGYAGDYVEGMWLMLQQEHPDTYVLATGETHTIREFVNEAAKNAGFDIVWQGTGIDETGIDKKSGKMLVKINPKFFRPAEVESLVGDASKAKQILGWVPKVSYKELCRMMMEADIERFKRVK